MNLIEKLSETATCLEESADIMRETHPGSIHIGQLEGAAGMIDDWISEIEMKNKKGD